MGEDQAAVVVEGQDTSGVVDAPVPVGHPYDGLLGDGIFCHFYCLFRLRFTKNFVQVLHDAFFKYQTKPKLTTHGDLYHEGKEFEEEELKGAIVLVYANKQ
ncbi:hypothetical protein Taro_000021, partial [Colocasia esculenta]|nr:hypothetical protein [Colocasia esculenta]